MSDDPSDIKIKALVARVRELLREKARRDPNAFNEYVLRDDEDPSRPVKQAPFHRDMQATIDAYPNCIFVGFVGSAKTQGIAIGRLLYELGKVTEHPYRGFGSAMKVIIVSKAESKQARKTLRQLRKYIETSQALHEVFPRLRPGEPWSDEEFSIEGHGSVRDPTVQIVGYGGSVQGSRAKIVIADDLLDYVNTRTDYQRKEVQHWFEQAVMTRRESNARIWFLTNAWNDEDAAQNLGRLPGWVKRTYPIWSPEGVPIWPERFPVERIIKIKGETHSLEFARMYECKPRSGDDLIWQQAWIDKCLARGVGKMMLNEIPRIPPGCFTVTGMDLQHGKKDPHLHRSCRFTILVHNDTLRSREVLCIRSGQWPAGEILREVQEANRLFGSTVIVESNGAQDYIVQLGHGLALAVEAQDTTSSNKHNQIFGVESIAGEMERGQWVIPCSENGTVHPEVEGWINEMLYYDPGAHTGDRLMACWKAREGARQVFMQHRSALTALPDPPMNPRLIKAEREPYTPEDLYRAQSQSIWGDLEGLLRPP